LTVYHFISLLCSWSCHSVCCAYIFSNPKTGLGLFLVPHGLITYEPMTITCLLQHVSWSRWSTGKTMTQCTGLREGISSSQLTVYHFISLLCSWSCHSVCCAYIFSNPKTGLGLFLVPHGLITLQKSPKNL